MSMIMAFSEGIASGHSSKSLRTLEILTMALCCLDIDLRVSLFKICLDLGKCSRQRGLGNFWKIKLWGQFKIANLFRDYNDIFSPFEFVPSSFVMTRQDFKTRQDFFASMGTVFENGNGLIYRLVVAAEASWRRQTPKIEKEKSFSRSFHG